MDKQRPKRPVRWEVLEKVGEIEDEVNNKKLSVLVEVERPVFTEEDGSEKAGRSKVAIKVTREKRFLTLTVNEAMALYRSLENLLPDARLVHSKCEEEHKAWLEQRRTHQREDDRRGVRHTGKTARKKAEGRAGADYHKRRKREKSARDRQINAEMRRGK